MSLEDIKRQELDQGELDVLKRDRERWEKMGAGSHLDEWLEYQPGLMIRRRLAMKLAHTNQPLGKAYAQAFNAFMKADGLDHMDKNSISALLWLGDDPERMQILREIREAMSPGERSRLNSPISARKRIEAILKARAGGTEEKERTSPVAMLKEKLMEAERKNAHLEEKLASAEKKLDDGSLFDLKRDSADHIIDAIIANVSAHKASTIFNGGAAKMKRKGKPAG